MSTNNMAASWRQANDVIAPGCSLPAGMGKNVKVIPRERGHTLPYYMCTVRIKCYEVTLNQLSNNITEILQ